MVKVKRQQVYDKYNGRCAYTGKPLDDKWQVDHIEPKTRFKHITVYEAHYKKIDTLQVISVDDYIEMLEGSDREGRWDIHCAWKYYPKRTKPAPEVDNITNLVPALRIVNHYKRDQNLEEFRAYMLSFHNRLKKLPKKTTVQRTIERKEYLQKIADAFDISIEKPFTGTFYFETINR